MEFLTDTANVFYISADEISRNELSIICEAIKQQIEERNGTYTFIFIEEPFYRWESEVGRQMGLLRGHFDGKVVINDLILPSDVYQEMWARNGLGKE